MPSSGLSLVGFMDEAQAIAHLKTACIAANQDDSALKAEWNSAKAKLGSSFGNAGTPDIQPLPSTADVYIQHLTQQPWLVPFLTGPWQGATFKLVELDPLLAYQFTVDTARSEHLCGSLPRPPTVADLLPVCLPVNPPNDAVHTMQQERSFIIKSRSLNLQMTAQGPLGQNAIGIIVGWAISLVHVVRYGGKYYLSNGFHRAFGARTAGATHVPAIVRDVSTPDEVGIRTDGSTFPAVKFTGAAVPTVGHFSQSRAYNVTLRAMTRILHVNWSEYAMYDE